MTDQKAEGGQGPEAEASARLRSQQGRALPSSGFAPELEPMQDALQERSRGSWPLRRITCAEELRNRRCVPRWPANYTQQPTSRARAGGKEATCTRLAAERGDVGQTMAMTPEVLFQRGGHGAIVFAGQSVPALAIRADELRRLHDLARAAMVSAKALDIQDQALRDSLQELHLEIADLLLELQDVGARHQVPIPARLHVTSSQFLTFDR